MLVSSEARLQGIQPISAEGLVRELRRLYAITEADLRQLAGCGRRPLFILDLLGRMNLPRPLWLHDHFASRRDDSTKVPFCEPRSVRYQLEPSLVKVAWRLLSERSVAKGTWQASARPRTVPQSSG